MAHCLRLLVEMTRFDVVVGLLAALMLAVCLGFLAALVWWFVVFFTS